MAAGGRVSIPAGARRTVADIKEIAGGHSDEEVYAMLRECSMDPNETAQRLLLQDTFHEVKRKRDKKKEGSKEPSDTRWRPAMHGRGGKSGRGNYSSHISANFNDSKSIGFSSKEFGVLPLHKPELPYHTFKATSPAGQITLGGKENGINQITEKGSGSTPNVNTNMAAKTSTSVASLSNSASQPDDLSTVVATNCTTVCDVTKSCSTALVNFKGCLPSGGQVSVIGPNAQQSLQSASDSVLVPSLNSHSLGDVGAPKQALGRKKTSVEHNVGHDLPADSKGFFQQAGSSSFGQSSGSRPSSSYSSRSQQSCGSQKVMSNKERKAKPTSTTAPEATEKVIILDNIALAADAVPQSVPMSNSVSKDDLLKVDKSFNDLQLVAKQHVIIPDHLQVSDSEKYGLCFGSFNANFQQTMGSTDLECAKMSSLPEDKSSSSIVQEEADLACHQLPSAKLEEYSPSAVVNSSSFPTESDQCRNDSATSGVLSSYSTFELAPHSHGNEILVIEESESKVQKPSDFSMSYCTQSYQPTGHSDERMSPFLVGEAASKNGDVPVVPARTDQDQEGNNLPVCAASVSASVANPAAGIIQTSIANRQQSIPVFRQSLGVHLSHFPTNYVPNNQYISPFFIPPPTLHPFLSNATFPQPPSTGVMYPTPGSAGVPPPVKYPVLSFKPGANTGSQVSIGVPGAYGTYGSITSVYTNNTTVPAGNPAVDDDVASAQVKENSIYIAGPQAEGSTLWVPAPGRDVSSLQAYSFYGFTPPGQVTFAPQAVHGPFGGIYHPAHNVTGAPVHSLLQPSHTVAGALEVVGAPGGVYQQPQAQMNWGNY